MQTKRIVPWALSLVFLLGLVVPAAAQNTRNDKNNDANMTVSRAEKLVGTKVKNPAGQDLGKVEDLVIDLATGKVRCGILSFGGFLGIGDKLFAVPFSSMKLRQTGDNERHFEINVTKQQLENAKGFDKNNWPNFADPTWTQTNDQAFIQPVPAKP
jgi:sporulation protein YlmC with PRC-barrel domain